MKYLLLLLASIAAFAQTHCVVNEIMFAPLGGEPEWVEVYNPTTQSFNLKNWKIRDMTATKKTISSKDAIIDPGGFMVLAHDTTIFNYHSDIPSPVVALSLPSLNNDSDAVILYDASGIVVDSLVYHNTWGGANGASLERIRFTVISTDKNNWRTSVDPEKSTPGRRNSVAPKPVDVAVDSVGVQNVDRTHVQVIAFLHNNGELAVDSLRMQFAVDRNNDNLIEQEEVVCDSSLGTLPPGGTWFVSFTTPALIASCRMLVAASAPRDGDSSNNTGAVSINIHHQKYSVVVNELSYAPVAPEPEWIELQNVGDDSVNCTGWHIASGSSAGTIAEAPTVAPGEYLVVARDTAKLFATHADVADRVVYAALPTLPNTAGTIVLKDDLNEWIDSVAYFSTWGGNNGATLERIDSSVASNDSANWRTSTASIGNTCGRRNSVARRNIDAGIENVWLNDDSTSLTVYVKNFGLHNAENIIVSAHIDSLADKNSTQQFPVMSLFNGSDAATTVPLGRLPLGENLVTICAEVENDEQPGNNCVQIRLHGALPLGSLAINEIMYSPRTGQPEYFELVNTGTASVNVLGCKYTGQVSATTHKADTMLFAAHPAIIDPGEYAVVAADTTIFTAYPTMPQTAHVIVQNKSTIGLNNDSDVIAIADAYGTTLDSLQYSSSWQSANVKNTTGIALEKINPRLPSTAASSWESSVAARGGTPGERNSVFALMNVATGQTVVPPTATIDASPNPFSPDGDGYEDNTSLRFTLPFQSSTFALRIYDAAGRLKRSLANTNRASTEGAVPWDGRDDNGAALPIGIYLAVLDAAESSTGNTVRVMAAVVVARRL